jgi:hypothetical protein
MHAVQAGNEKQSRQEKEGGISFQSPKQARLQPFFTHFSSKLFWVNFSPWHRMILTSVPAVH